MSEIFKISMATMQKEIHEYARSKGFWDDGAGEDSKKLLLIHTEISEAAEELRKGDLPYDISQEHPSVQFDANKYPQFSHVEIELADAVIRIMDYAESKKFNLGAAILAKHEINLQRPYRHGGKKF